MSEHDEHIEQAHLYYLEHDGKSRQRLQDVNNNGEKNHNWKGGLVSFNCVFCGKEKRVKQKDLSRSKYCSTICAKKAIAISNSERAKLNRIKKNCVICGKEILLKKSHAEKEGTYCSIFCRTIGYRERFSNMTYDRVDENQTEIVKALEGIGASVFSTSRVKFGFPDLVVGYRGANYLLEVKTEKGVLTPAQKKFFSEWNGQKAIIKTVDEAFSLLGVI